MMASVHILIGSGKKGLDLDLLLTDSAVCLLRGRKARDSRVLTDLQWLMMRIPCERGGSVQTVEGSGRRVRRMKTRVPNNAEGFGCTPLESLSARSICRQNEELAQTYDESQAPDPHSGACCKSKVL